VPLPELITLGLAVSLSFVVWAVLRYTDLGKALRASAEDSAVAAAFRHQRETQCAAAGRHLFCPGQHCRCVPGAGLHARAVADLCLDRRGLPPR